jgi:hypothetical protein
MAAVLLSIEVTSGQILAFASLIGGPLANICFQWSLGLDIRLRVCGQMESECQIHSTGAVLELRNHVSP